MNEKAKELDLESIAIDEAIDKIEEAPHGTSEISKNCLPTLVKKCIDHSTQANCTIIAVDLPVGTKKFLLALQIK